MENCSVAQKNLRPVAGDFEGVENTELAAATGYSDTKTKQAAKQGVCCWFRHRREGSVGGHEINVIRIAPAEEATVSECPVSGGDAASQAVSNLKADTVGHTGLVVEDQEIVLIVSGLLQVAIPLEIIGEGFRCANNRSGKVAVDFNTIDVERE